MKDVNHLFTLRVKTSQGLVTINAYEGPWPTKATPSHTRIDVEVKLLAKSDNMYSKVIFRRGSLWCGIPAHHSIDGIYAKECVLSLVAMKPGDTDADYFAEYSREQRDFAESLGDELNMIREMRYCDPKTGEVKL